MTTKKEERLEMLTQSHTGILQQLEQMQQDRFRLEGAMLILQEQIEEEKKEEAEVKE